MAAPGDRRQRACKDFEKVGATIAVTPCDVVEEADITFSCVADPQAAKEDWRQRMKTEISLVSSVINKRPPGACRVLFSRVQIIKKLVLKPEILHKKSIRL
ncbi:Putative oxidoreductase GLYR1-like [Papilio xuthus]|uniref:Putative oxidoreductase GLYR1-like n=1 Tax=Papilio xuthus TaxID=66420 RepID=A0A0N1IBM2_PAPXU|nr:Putative oxidoreductase GLYR1-like [Papilio xuthus]